MKVGIGAAGGVGVAAALLGAVARARAGAAAGSFRGLLAGAPRKGAGVGVSASAGAGSGTGAPATADAGAGADPDDGLDDGTGVDPGGHGRGGGKGTGKPAPAGEGAASYLDPVERHAAQLAPPVVMAPPPEAPVETRARSSLEDLLPALVRKVAWSGDGRRGAIRLELGAGAMAGAQVVVESDEGRVRVHLVAPAGVDGDAWRRRIAARLAGRGLAVDDVRAE